MAERTAWVEAVGRLLARVAESDVTELELARGDFRVRIRRRPGEAARPGAPPAPAGEEPATEYHPVKAPLTGVFYRSSSPTARPYVVEGDFVEPESVVGLIETMKIFNEVTADTAGRVVKFLATSGQLVHAGDVLLLVDPTEQATGTPELLA